MPPKPKFTCREIVDAAVELINEKGPEALTARELGQRLGSSVRPIFTVFQNMEEVKQQARREAQRQFESYVEQEVPGMPAFKQIGVQTVHFAMEKPRLFQLLYMRQPGDTPDFALYFHLNDTAALCMKTLQEDYQLTASQAELLFQQMWIDTFGMAALCAMRVCRFSEEEISRRLTFTFRALLIQVKKGEKESAATAG